MNVKQGAIDNAKACLEEEAVLLDGSIAYRATISAAISLKRIADAIEADVSVRNQMAVGKVR